MLKQSSEKVDIEEIEFEDKTIGTIVVNGVKLMRGKDSLIAFTNIPHLVCAYSKNGYEFGRRSATVTQSSAFNGHYDLALNIVEIAIAHIGIDSKYMECYAGECTALAWMLHRRFCDEMIKTLPFRGGRLEWKIIIAWIISQPETKQYGDLKTIRE